MKISIIVAIGNSRQIGLEGEIPWHSSEDLKYFRDKTMGHTIVMGRITFESLPENLDGRKIIVLSKDLDSGDNFIVARSVENAIEIAQEQGEKELFIAGGSKIYEDFLQLADKIYLTKIYYIGEADRYFSELGPEWVKTSEKSFSDGAFITFIRI